MYKRKKSRSNSLFNKLNNIRIFWLIIFIIIAFIFIWIVRSIRQIKTDIEIEKDLNKIINSFDKKENLNLNQNDKYINTGNQIIDKSNENINKEENKFNTFRKIDEIENNVVKEVYNNNLDNNNINNNNNNNNNNYKEITEESKEDQADTSKFDLDAKDLELINSFEHIGWDFENLDLINNIMNLNVGLETVLLIIASNRPQYLEKCLDNVIRFHPRISIPIIISEDGNSPQNAKVINEFKRKFSLIAPKLQFIHVHHEYKGNPGDNGYIKLSAHFKFALTQSFSVENFDTPPKQVIILEEDLLIAPDFFFYFSSLVGLLNFDSSLLAASAWNDNGQAQFVQDNQQLYRSDFFPGLGWMLTKTLWNELKPKWPKGYWDDWLREPEQRKGRNIIRPEVCRTYHIGSKGVSNSQYSEYLANIKLNDKFVNFLTVNMGYIQKDQWDLRYVKAIKKVPIVTTSTFSIDGPKEVRIIYDSLEGRSSSFVAIARWAGIMDNIKANVPRTAYKGIVSIWKDGIKLHITPTDIN